MTDLLQVVLVLGLLGQSPVSLSDLTVPASLMPLDCALPPSPSERLDDGRLRGGLWAGLTITSNPWWGNDAVAIARIRERMVSGLAAPDAPPLDRRDLARYRLALADGLEEGYAAVYAYGDPPTFTAVYAVRFEEAAGWPQPEQDVNVLRVSIGQIEVVVHGQGDPCHEAVSAYVQSIGAAR
jgi:hypothetical protein